MRSIFIVGFFSILCVACSNSPISSDENDLKAKKRELREFFESKIPADKKCDFAQKIDMLDSSKAKAHAQSEYALDDIYFYGVFDGFGPSRPNFEFKFTRCVVLESKWEFINAGHDVITCRGQAKLAEKANEYAAIFNREMTKLVRKDPKSYLCPDAISSH
ncbi:hypothetical protein CW748_10710 [Alteromonadales bacterium alter-6D02]|nr:hypothetical protein CW748_10710 [Alteromonadales bacterium alter-6D02]